MYPKCLKLSNISVNVLANKPYKFSLKIFDLSVIVKMSNTSPNLSALKALKFKS